MTKTELIAKATAKGFTINTDHGTLITKKKTSLALRVFPNGTILRQDVRLDLARRMTVKEAAGYLGI